MSGTGRLASVPQAPTGPRPQPGLHWLSGTEGAGPVLFVPRGLMRGPVGLVVLFHGATQEPMRVLPILHAEAERRGVLVLAPKSQGRTWDMAGGQFGPDVEQVDAALRLVFDHVEIDPQRLAISGFSDGASYALSLGLRNGDLFRHVFAFSPGFFLPGDYIGTPRFFVSHGMSDTVLAIDQTSRRVVPMLEQLGYSVDYREFDGGHDVPPALATAALDSLR